MITRLILLALLATATAAANAQATPSKWPTEDGAYDIANFHFAAPMATPTTPSSSSMAPEATPAR